MFLTEIDKSNWVTANMHTFFCRQITEIYKEEHMKGCENPQFKKQTQRKGKKQKKKELIRCTQQTLARAKNINEIHKTCLPKKGRGKKHIKI